MHDNYMFNRQLTAINGEPMLSAGVFGDTQGAQRSVLRVES